MYRKSSKKIRPGLLSYSLGRLCDSLNLDNRHRAGVTDATAILFSRLLEWDTDKEMDKMIKKHSIDQRLPLIYLKKILSNYQINRGVLFL
jgi:DNA polymerase-3 subunit epsilon